MMLNVKAVVATFNQENALVGVFFVFIQLRTSRRFASSSNYVGTLRYIEVSRNGGLGRVKKCHNQISNSPPHATQAAPLVLWPHYHQQLRQLAEA